MINMPTHPILCFCWPLNAEITTIERIKNKTITHKLNHSITIIPLIQCHKINEDIIVSEFFFFGFYIGRQSLVERRNASLGVIIPRTIFVPGERGITGNQNFPRGNPGESNSKSFKAKMQLFFWISMPLLSKLVFHRFVMTSKC